MNRYPNDVALAIADGADSIAARSNRGDRPIAVTVPPIRAKKSRRVISVKRRRRAHQPEDRIDPLLLELQLPVARGHLALGLEVRLRGLLTDVLAALRDAAAVLCVG